MVSSSVDANRTFLKLLEPGSLSEEFVEKVRQYKFRGSSGKVNLALDALPDFTCLPGRGRHLRGAISISPSMEYMERAYDDAKYGDYSRRPYLDIVIPSLTDPSVAPPGKHVMSCFAQYAPYHLCEGTWDEKREAFGDCVIETLAEYAPNIKNIIVGGAIANFTDVKKTFGGIIAGFRKAQSEGKLNGIKIWVRRGGPREKEGLEAMKALQNEGFDINVFDRHTPLTDIVDKALQHK